ncbi:hypothetical protein BV20DRAFT_955204 [Pilatotrama ljubarskyi]|nr:hypothetical protein BV20DRAFT_955204 [Pilatotrama ljubarskyi]
MVTLAGSHPKKFFPLPGRFGVIQMDPVAMVEPLGDEEALHLAKAIQTRKYLAYLLCNMELPWPNRPWYGYYILPIGPTLRSEVPEKAITADMCVPIAPNVAHPSGRPPVVTEPPFPFSNCYYWVDSETRVRVRSGIEFDEAHAVCLPHMTRSKLQRVFDEDMDRAYDAIEERRNAAMEEDQHDLAAETSPEKTTDSSASNDESDPHLFDRPDERSCSSSSSCGESSPSQSVDSFKAFAAFDPFGFHLDADIELCPLVDFCFDLTDHIAQDEIGDPVDFWREGAEVAA